MEILENKLKDLRKDVPLKEYTTFKIGGPAKYFYVANNKEDLLKAVNAAEESGVDYYILGWGSNLLVSDEGYEGLVIKVEGGKYEIKDGLIRSDAGVNLSKLVGEAAQAGLSGLEFAAGIPGTIGGCVRGNAGAYGKSISDLVLEVSIYEAGKVKTLSKKDMLFDYRASRLKNHQGVVLEVVLKLAKGRSEEIKAAILKTLRDRAAKLPVEPSAGCIFKNIELDQIDYDKDRIIKALDISEGEWNEATSHGKLPVGYIIDCLGLKGKKIGGCQISEKHSAFFVNSENATAAHVMMLMSDIKMRVRNRLGIQLQEEIELLGF